jgi:DNA-directed RNA polymerase alpha subunit
MFPANRRRRRIKGEINPTILASWTDKQKQQEDMHKALEMPLAEAGLPVRVVNTMEANGVFLVKDLLEETEEDLINTANIGDKTIKEIASCIRKLGLDPPWPCTLKKASSPPKNPRKSK